MLSLEKGRVINRGYNSSSALTRKYYIYYSIIYLNFMSVIIIILTRARVLYILQYSITQSYEITNISASSFGKTSYIDFPIKSSGFPFNQLAVTLFIKRYVPFSSR